MALNHDTSHPAEPWTQHWQLTLQGSIDLQADDPVASALRTCWSAALPHLKATRSLVDVGSGPAILARLMPRLGWPAEHPTLWWCVDQARLGHDWRSALPSTVRILDQTDFCRSSPPEGPADALVSNFGLEYMPLEAVAQALPRWLRPGAYLCAVLHARDSIVDQVSRQHESDLQVALQELDLHGRAMALVQALATAPQDPMLRMMHGVEVRDAYNAAVNRLKEVMEQRGQASPVLMEMLQGATTAIRLVPSQGEAAAHESLRAQQQAYRAEQSRLQQMQASALDAQQAQAWLAALQLVSPNLRLEHLNCSLGAIGWNLRAVL